jgi:hypothetical protein
MLLLSCNTDALYSRYDGNGRSCLRINNARAHVGDVSACTEGKTLFRRKADSEIKVYIFFLTAAIIFYRSFTHAYALI